MGERLKVLICAYACSPYQGSEPGVGWGFVQALAARHDLWVIVEEEKFRADIERYLAAQPALASQARFFFVRKSRHRLLRRLWPPSYYWFYRAWHRDALALARRLHEEVRFDLVHQLTMVGFREPGFLWQLGVPFVWGPIGGMDLFPWAFLGKVGLYGGAYYLGYNLANLAQMRFAPRPRRAALAAASGLVAATPENQAAALARWGVHATLLAEVGLPCEPAPQVRTRSDGEPLRVVWAGVHVPRKALNLGIEALAAVPEGLHVELTVLGRGRCSDDWKRLAARLGVAERCRFPGWLPRSETLEIMQSAHALLITSLRDLTSTVTIEALAMGLPIVCLDHCGFAHVVDECCGLKVPVSTPDAVVAGLARALAALASDEQKRQQLAAGALQRAQAFSWEGKAAVLDRVYRQRLAGLPASLL